MNSRTTGDEDRTAHWNSSERLVRHGLGVHEKPPLPVGYDISDDRLTISKTESRHRDSRGKTESILKILL